MNINTTKVLAAFEMLLEEIENEVELVNRVGAKAFSDGDYEGAKLTIDQAETIADFRSRVASLRREWRELREKLALAEDEDEEAAAQRRDLGRLKRGIRTPEDAFRLPILRTLSELGGEGPVRDVLTRVEEIMREELHKADYEMLPSSPTTARWYNTGQWARNSMVKEGLLKDDSPRGIWEISRAGRKYLKSESGSVATG